MAQSMLRALYRGLLYLHPPAFRQRFAEEMLWVFDEAAATRGILGLFADGLVSLLRQGIVRPESWHAPLAAIAPARAGSSAFFAWEHFEVPQDGLPLYRWMQGSVISLGMLSAVWLMAGQGGRAPRLPKDSTALPSSKAARARPPPNSQGSPAGIVARGTGGEGDGSGGVGEAVRAGPPAPP